MDELPSNQEKGNTNDAGEDGSKQVPSKSGENDKITNTDKNEGDKKQEVNWPSRIQAGATVALIVITLIYTYYSREQAEQMRNAVKIAQDTYVAGENSLKSTLTEMKRQSAATEQSVQLAERNIKATQEQFRLDQRAWLNLREPKFMELPNSQKFRQIYFIIKNTGKTPAQPVFSRYKMWIQISGETTFKTPYAALTLTPFMMGRHSRCEGV
jgi:hypothetical protein